MPTNIPKISARFETTLATSMAKGASAFTLTSGTDKAGNPLSGLYGFVIDNGTASEEFVIGSVSGNAVTSVVTGLDPANPQTTISALQQSHRKGASVKITDYPILAFLREMVNGNPAFTLDNVLAYTAPPAWVSGSNQLATVKKVEDTTAAGAPDASASVKGISKTSVAPASAPNPIVVGDNDPRVPTQGENDSLVGNDTSIAVGSGNKMVVQTGLQNKAETYGVTTGSANAYVLTLSPVPTAYVAGQEFEFKANFGNTGASTLNVNGLGAKAIKKLDGASALKLGDIANGQVVKVKYDGTNFQMLSTPASVPPGAPIYTSGATSYDITTASGTQTIAHGLGKVPNYIRLRYLQSGSASAANPIPMEVTYQGASQAALGLMSNGGPNFAVATSFKLAALTGGNNDFASGVITVDATNIIITWTKNGSPASLTYQGIWEAFANGT